MDQHCIGVLRSGFGNVDEDQGEEGKERGTKKRIKPIYMNVCFIIYIRFFFWEIKKGNNKNINDSAFR